jgi:hypothetical protein
MQIPKQQGQQVAPLQVTDKPVARVNGAVLTDRDLLRERVLRGLDFELYADDEAAALETALAASPEGAFAERVVPMEIDVQLDEGSIDPPPEVLRSEGEGDADYAARQAASQADYAARREAAREAARVAKQERQAAIDRGEEPAHADLPQLPIPEWPELTEAEAAAWEARKAAEAAAKPPVSTDPTGAGFAASRARASGVPSEPAAHEGSWFGGGEART